MAVQRPPKPKVGGSSPSWPAIYSHNCRTAKPADLGAAERILDMEKTASLNKVGKSGKSTAKTAKGPGKPGPIQRSKNFVDDVRNEMDKVTWPSKEELKASTTVTIIFLAIIAVIVGIMDVVFQNVVLWLLRTV